MCIKVRVEETWGLKHPLMNLTFRFKIGRKLKDWFLKLGGVMFGVGPPTHGGKVMPH